MIQFLERSLVPLQNEMSLQIIIESLRSCNPLFTNLKMNNNLE